MTEIIKFYADWCGPCKSQYRILDEIRREGYVFEWTDINIEDSSEENLSLVAQYGVRSIPTLVVLKEDSEPVVFRGFTPKEKLREVL